MSLTIKRQVDLAKQTQIRRAQCDVALAFLKTLKSYPDQPWLLLEQPEEAVPLTDIGRLLEQNPNLKNDPDVKIEIQKAKTVHLSPVKLCSNLKKWVRENRVRVEPGHELRADSIVPDWQKPNKNDKFDWHIVQVSMPVISANGSSAYLNVSEYFGPLGGGGDALEYKKLPDGNWKLSERFMRYIS